MLAEVSVGIEMMVDKDARRFALHDILLEEGKAVRLVKVANNNKFGLFDGCLCLFFVLLVCINEYTVGTRQPLEEVGKDVGHDNSHRLAFPFEEVLQGKRRADGISVRIDMRTDDDTIILTIDCGSKLFDATAQKTLFLCELTYGALVTLDIPEEMREAALMVEIPHMIYPYARQIVGNMIQQAGFPALQINPIDFMGLYQEKKAKAAKANESK